MLKLGDSDWLALLSTAKSYQGSASETRTESGRNQASETTCRPMCTNVGRPKAGLRRQGSFAS